MMLSTEKFYIKSNQRGAGADGGSSPGGGKGERAMIRTLNDFERLAGEKGPKRMAVLAPEDEEFMLAVKKSWEKGYIEPVLIGNEGKIAQAAEKVAFDLGPFEKIAGGDLQGISDLGIKMLFAGEAPIAGKGQIPTSYIYRSIIRAEAKAASGMTVSVVTFWEIPGCDHLVAFTDTGVNITPDLKAKREIVKNAVFAYHLLGFPRPRIAVLSGQREVGGKLGSYEDYEVLRDEAAAGGVRFLRGRGGHLLHGNLPGRPGPRDGLSTPRGRGVAPHPPRSLSRYGQHHLQARFLPRREPQLPGGHVPGAGMHPRPFRLQ